MLIEFKDKINKLFMNNDLILSKKTNKLLVDENTHTIKFGNGNKCVYNGVTFLNSSEYDLLVSKIISNKYTGFINIKWKDDDNRFWYMTCDKGKIMIMSSVGSTNNIHYWQY
jgi:hypothetical protein